MGAVHEIERAINGLTHEKLAELRSWLSRFDAGEWDKQIEQDAATGKLDEFYRHIQAENEGYPEVALRDFIDQAFATDCR
jgi:hypothetical protein